jgi:hypothetical protein
VGIGGRERCRTRLWRRGQVAERVLRQGWQPSMCWQRRRARSTPPLACAPFRTRRPARTAEVLPPSDPEVMDWMAAVLEGPGCAWGGAGRGGAGRGGAGRGGAERGRRQTGIAVIFLRAGFKIKHALALPGYYFMRVKTPPASHLPKPCAAPSSRAPSPRRPLACPQRRAPLHVHRLQHGAALQPGPGLPGGGRRRACRARCPRPRSRRARRRAGCTRSGAGRPLRLAGRVAAGSSTAGGSFRLQRLADQAAADVRAAGWRCKTRAAPRKNCQRSASTYLHSRLAQAIGPRRLPAPCDSSRPILPIATPTPRTTPLLMTSRSRWTTTWQPPWRRPGKGWGWDEPRAGDACW